MALTSKPNTGLPEGEALSPQGETEASSPAGHGEDPGPIKGWMASLGEALFAPQCHLCTAPTPWDVPVCEACASGILPIAPGCPRCGLPGTPALCEACETLVPAYDRARSFGIFEGTLREAIHTLKFNDAPQVGGWLGALMAPAIPHLLPPPSPTLIVPVPLPAHRQKKRGYNQARALAEPIAQRLGLPLIDALERKSAEGSQSKVGRARRLARLKGAFTLRAKIRGHRVLLVDDVMTTGATATACAAVLKAGGAVTVDVFTAARTPA